MHTKPTFHTTNIAKPWHSCYKYLIYNMLYLIHRSRSRNKGTRKPTKSPILTILNHLYGIEHVKKILRNVPLSVPLSVPLFRKKRILSIKKAQTPIKQLFTTTYQVRLDDHRPPGDFTASVHHTGM